MKRGERTSQSAAQARSGAAPSREGRSLSSTVKNALFSYLEVTKTELEVLDLLERARPESLRDFDQIPMRGTDLLCQVKLVAPDLAGRHVAFVGDHDGTSLLLGLLSSRGLVRPPARMTLLDFDDRLLEAASALAGEHGFPVETRLYNVFDPLPGDLRGEFDVYYTNPPYGASNQGESARLFVTRGSELIHRAGRAYLLLPNDRRRPWTQNAMRATQLFLLQHGWSILASLPDMHRYHLDDDRTLASSLMIADWVQADAPPMPWAGRHISATDIPHFYGRSVLPPYPRFISADGRELMTIDVLP